MSTRQVDSQLKANLDRVNRGKMNSLQRVHQLPARGGAGDWVVIEEVREQNGEQVKVDVTYAWIDNKWTVIGARGDVSVFYSSQFGDP